MKNKIAEVQVRGLQETFDYDVEFKYSKDVAILIAPNGYGKTALLSLLNACLQFKLAEAARLSFSTLMIRFENGSKWSFEKTREQREPREIELERRYTYRRREPRPRDWVKVEFFDERGKRRVDRQAGGFEAIPTDILARALDRCLPLNRLTYDTFKDMPTGDVLSAAEVVNRYHVQLLNDEDFKEYLGPYHQLFLNAGEDRPNCVFIETQRLLYAKKTASRDTGSSTTVQEEEITRQSNYLANLLKDTFANYAATSQALDRSFPNRLITRASATGPKEFHNLRSELDAIESRRQDLTKAGILVETSEPLVAPKDEFLVSVSDALSIYVEDSKAKLSTFDQLYPKVSVFKDLINKKLSTKELIIGQNGAVVRRGKTEIELEGLSSGEKHEFIMLFRLVFETPPESFVLIDEPEISLHVLWQLEFMSDLRAIQGANPFQAIIATHSPQIFQDVEELIVDLADQVQ